MPPPPAPSTSPSTPAALTATASAATTATVGAPGAAPPRLLTLGRVCDLFCNRLAISETTYYESHRPFLPVVYTRMMPVRGRAGEYRPGSPRLREDVARELVEIAATGQWEAYLEGAMQETHPHLYPRKPSAV